MRWIHLIIVVLVMDHFAMAESPEPNVPPVNEQADSDVNSSEQSANGTTDQPAKKEGGQWKIPEIKIPMKTLGGRQFWGDCLHFRGWRIQQSTIDDSHRLLDPDDYRYQVGTYQECLEKLEEIKKEKEMPPLSGKAVILIHGITRSSHHFSAMKKHLQKDGWQTVGFDYPSTQASLEQDARYLDDVLKSLEGIDEICIVVHSMGGLVVRTYLAEHQDERIKRMVMVGTPNSGSPMADMLKSNLLYKKIMGQAGQKLTVNNDEIQSLPVPKFEFGIVAGGRGNNSGYNPIIKGDDDGTVAVESAKLSGATDMIVVPSLHSFLVQNTEAIEHIGRYLKTGAFRESGERSPVK